KGKNTIIYRNRTQGFEGWYPIKNKASGIQLITKLVAVLGQKVQVGRIRYSEPDDAAKAYPDTPEETTILGEKVILGGQRPLAEVRFQNADIKLATSRRTIPLVRLRQNVYKA
ncbi:MAG TPA: hypothetical protein VK211_08755, partial [Kamptonema sp.]|nr:hypothetical protein [Kamptonema sp.]